MSSKKRMAKWEREDYFDKLCKQMEKSGYKLKYISSSALAINLWATAIALPLLAIVLVVYYFVNGFDIARLNYFSLTVALLASIAGIVVHELIHGLFLGIFAKEHFKSVYFGVWWKTLAPYCTCIEPLRKRQYIIVLLMPTLILGVGASIAAVVLGNTELLLFSIIMLAGGGGDLYIMFRLGAFRRKHTEQLILDNPVEVGCVVAYKEKIIKDIKW